MPVSQRSVAAPAFTPPRRKQSRRDVNRSQHRHTGICMLYRLPTSSVVITKLENVAIANALQLEAARRRAVPIRFKFVARVKFELAQPIRCRLRAFLLLIRYVTLWPWTLTPWLGTFVVCRLCYSQTLYEIWAQSGNQRRRYCSLKFDLMTLNMYHVLRYALR